MSDKFNPDHGHGRSLPALALTRAGGNSKPAHASIYLLADHLDTVLAACEDIAEARLTWNRARRAGPDQIATEKHNARNDIEQIRKLENTVIMRVLKSRERAEEVSRVDKRFRQLARLYIAGTAVLVDAVEDCNDCTDSDFATADSIPAYLRTRGLIDPEAPAPAIGEDLPVGEDFLIAKRIAAGPLMDLAAALLDSLELHYDLFLDEDELALPPQINRFDTGDAADEINPPETKSDDSNLGAVIEDVREEAAKDAPESIDPEIWTRLSAPNTTTPDAADQDDSENDLPPELAAMDADRADDVVQEGKAHDLWTRLATAAMAKISARGETTEDPTADADTPETDDATAEHQADGHADATDKTPETSAIEAADTEASEDEIPTEIVGLDSSSQKEDAADASPSAEGNDETTDDGGDSAAQPDGDATGTSSDTVKPIAAMDTDEDESRTGDTDDSGSDASDVQLVISAANDDDSAAASDDPDPSSSAPADNSEDNAEPDVAAKDTENDADAAGENEGSASDDDDQAESVAAAQDKDDDPQPDGDPPGRKKSKSLLRRLSLVRS